jgi:fructose-bisphosphate aldolase class II
VPLVTEYSQVKEAYREATERGVALPAFCAEDRETLEAILAAGLDIAERTGVPDLPIIPAWTGRYPARGQAGLVSACGDARLGTRLMFADLQVFTGPDSPYRKLRVMPHLDHASPERDGDLLEDFADQFASVMHDASDLPLDENMRLTAAYRERMGERVLVEGAVAQLSESGDPGHGGGGPTTVEQAQRFVRMTGVDLIVPDLGTEHRATAAGAAQYLPDRAREISAAVGKIICLHGASSVAAEALPSLPGDGVVKVNIFTTLAVYGGQAVARKVLEDLPEILPEPGCGGPKLQAVANAPRRDAWFAAVKARCLDFLRVFGYENWGA